MARSDAAAAVARPAPKRRATWSAGRQRLRPDARVCAGEVSFQTLRGLRSDGDGYEQRSPLPGITEVAMSPTGTLRLLGDVRFYAAVGGQADIGHVSGRARAWRSRPCPRAPRRRRS